MSKRARRQPGFYASLMSDVCDRGGSKYRPKVKPTVMGVYEVERVVAKRVKGGKEEYYIQWKNYSPCENTWEPAEHLSEDLIAVFHNRSADPIRADECRERLTLLLEKGLKTSLLYSETITMRHDVLRAIFPGLPSDLCGTPNPPPPPPPSEEELIAAGLGSFLKKCLTVTGGGCRVNAPVNLKLFLGKSPAFSAQWRKYRSSLRRVISPDACSEPNAA